MLGGAIVTTNGGFTRYNSMQLQYRRRPRERPPSRRRRIGEPSP
jgi:hypothetical protein